jgi:hypothetical protein
LESTNPFHASQSIKNNKWNMHQTLRLYTTNMVDAIWNLYWSLECKFENPGQFWFGMFFQKSSFILRKVWAFESPQMFYQITSKWEVLVLIF